MKTKIGDRVAYRRRRRKRCTYGTVIDVRLPHYVEIEPSNIGWKRIWVDEKEIVRWTWDKPVKPKKNEGTKTKKTSAKSS